MATLNVIYRIAADISGLRAGVEQSTATMQGMEKSARQLGAAIGAAFSIDKINAAATATLNMTGQIDDLARKVGISAEAVQELDFVAKQSGSSFETVSAAIGQMNKRLVGGDETAVGSLQLMGLELSSLLNMQPDQAFQTIATAIAQIPDPMERSKAAMDIFGRSGAELLPVLTSDIGALRDRARDMGLVLSNEVVAAGDGVGDSFEALSGKLAAMRANALIPLMSAFLELPAPMQTVLGIGYELAPSLQGIGIAILAAGGPTAALGLLTGAATSFATYITGGFMASMGAVTTFFTATLPSAFAATIAFLGPQGLIALAIIALGAIWFKWGDEITAIVKKVYNAIKEWLVDKFAGIVQSVREKIESIKNYFRGMYDAVVGNSYVPDMVDRIGEEFVRMGGMMEGSTRTATTGVEGIFQGMVSRVSGMVTGWLGDMGAKMGGWLGNFLPSFGGALEGGLRSILSSAGSFFSGGLSGIIGAGLGALGNMLFDTESKKVNDLRDTFFSQFGGAGTDAGSGFHNVAAQLVDLLGEGAGHSLFQSLIGASKIQDFQFAMQTVMDVLRRGPIPMAAGGAGVVNRPTLFMAGEKGPEAFAFMPPGRGFGGGHDSKLANEVRAMKQALLGALGRQADAIGIAVRDELVKVL